MKSYTFLTHHAGYWYLTSCVGYLYPQPHYPKPRTTLLWQQQQQQHSSPLYLEQQTMQILFLITTKIVCKKYNTWINTYPSWRHQMKPWFSTFVFILHMLFLKHKCKVRSSLCFLLLRCSDNTCILLYISWKTWRRLGCLLHGSNDTTSCVSMIQQLSHNWHTSWRWRISLSPIWITICECYAILYLQRE